MKRFLYLGAVLFLFVICSGCGDVFRPIIIPNPPKFPNPAASHSVLTLSDNGTVTGGVETAQIGSAMTIDVSGDTDESQSNIGLVPIHAVQQSATQVIVVDQSVSGANQDSLTRLTFSGTSISTVTDHQYADRLGAELCGHYRERPGLRLHAELCPALSRCHEYDARHDGAHHSRRYSTPSPSPKPPTPRSST